MATFPFTVVFRAGNSVAQITDYFLSCDPTLGAIEVQLPSTDLFVDGRAKSGASLPFNYSFADISGKAATNNITFKAAAGELINGAASVVISTNRASGTIDISSEGNWALNSSALGGGGGSTVYGIAINTAAMDVAANDVVTFSEGGTVVSGITAPAPAGTTFTVLKAGVYEYDFQVNGIPNNGGNSSDNIRFAIYVNGSTTAPNNLFASNSVGGDRATLDKRLCVGHGFIVLSAGDTVTLNNATASPLGIGLAVAISDYTLSGGECVSAMLSLELIA